VAGVLKCTGRIPCKERVDIRETKDKHGKGTLPTQLVHSEVTENLSSRPGNLSF
jgi:hypothetical protein